MILHGFMVSYVGNFGYHDVEQLTKRSVVLIVSLGNCQKHMAGEHHGHMRSKAIIRKAVVLLTKQQAAFAGLEKHFYIPAVTVDADDAIFAILVLANFYSYGQEIPGTAPAFLAGGKNLLDVHGFSFEDVESLATALYHGYCIKAQLLDIQQLLGIESSRFSEISSRRCPLLILAERSVVKRSQLVRVLMRKR